MSGPDIAYVALMLTCLISGMISLQAAMRSGYVYDTSKYEAPAVFLLAFILWAVSVGCAFNLGMMAEAIQALKGKP